MSASPNDVKMEEDQRNSVDSVVEAMKETKMARKVIILLVVLLLVLLVGMFAFAFLAIQMTKEIHQANGELVDSDGQRLTTSPRLDELPSDITVNKKRLLSASANSIELSDELEIPAELYRKAKEDYANGRTDWIVPLPGGHVITTQIQGWSANEAWGICTTCDTDSTWMASCSGGQTMCPIKLKPSGTQRRELRDRSMPPGTSDGSEAESSDDDVFDRSLREKNCW